MFVQMRKKLPDEETEIPAFGLPGQLHCKSESLNVKEESIAAAVFKLIGGNAYLMTVQLYISSLYLLRVTQNQIETFQAELKCQNFIRTHRGRNTCNPMSGITSS